ncbi:MAG: type II toxin-antitoxin system HicB family antitoxin [Stellaceae bacterium]
MYTVVLDPDDNGTLLVICPDLPEVTTFGEDENDALLRAADAIEEALAARIASHQDIPGPSEPALAAIHHRPSFNYHSGMGGLLTAPSLPTVRHRLIHLPPLTTAKVELYRAVRAQGVSKAELARRLGWRGPQVDRLFNLNHHSTIEHIDQALRAIGKRLVVNIEDAA